jgi:hypothetical protein
VSEVIFLFQVCYQSDKPFIFATLVSCIQNYIYGVFLIFRNYTGVISSVGTLLIFDLKARLSENKSYHCPFRLDSPQHPFITVLKQNKDTWYDVFSVMKFICNHNEEM